MFEMFKKNKSSTELFSPASGKMVKIEDVKDPLFSQKLMGDGFAVYPNKGTVTSPVKGKIVSIFPTKHAIGIQTDSGKEIIIHIGINTVELEGIPFTLFVKDGDKISASTKMVEIDLEYLKQRDLDPTIIVVFTNSSKDEGLEIYKFGNVENKEIVGEIRDLH